MRNKLNQIKRLNLQAWDLCKKDAPKAIQLAQQAQQLLSDCAEAQPIDEFECLKTQTYCLDILSKPEEALPIGLKANQLAEQIGDNYLIGYIKSLLGRIYWHIDDFPTSMEYYIKALDLVQTENHLDLEISLINGLGLVQFGQENYAESLGYFKTCLEKASEEDLTGRADANNNIAYVLHILGRDQEALDYGMAGLSQFNQISNSIGTIRTLHTLGAIHCAIGNYDQAMTFLQQGIELTRQNNNQLIEINFILEISRIHQIYGQLDQAESEILQALQGAEKINSLTNISLIHERLVEITRKQADLYRELAATDFLTSLVNRRRFLEIAELAYRRAVNEKGLLAIIMLDIDHFKSVNDQYGHKAGDVVLSSVASWIKKSLRQADIAGRYGGEEFIVLVSDTSSEICFKIAERICQAVACQSIRIDQTDVSKTISLGLACLNPDQVLPLDVLINNADQAMYIAKQQGRNRVVAWV